MNQMIRPPAVAGKFYPLNKDELQKQIDDDFEEASDLIKHVELPEGKKPRALIVPHAGYLYSGVVAAAAYSQVKEATYDEVFLFGSSHAGLFDGIALSDYKEWDTPLGRVQASSQVEKIAESDDAIRQNIFIENTIHKPEHSLEVQLPFLQVAIGDKFSIVPGLVGDGSPRILADSIDNFVEKDDLIIVSTDLSHYHDTLEAEELDEFAIKSILNLDSEPFENATKSMSAQDSELIQRSAEACGASAVALLIEIAKKRKWSPKRILYMNSGDITGNNFRVVGYAAVGFYE
ncbi:AmmeMemoRadiSam system protein B [Candidatus Dojkabacteria bacterium]|nr:AmmeMemoRadiSam system protein B [Candidatus Dojkabacteria bacterium]